MSSLLQLPVEVLINIFRYLELADLGNIMLTCRMLKDLVLLNNSIWRSVCRSRMVVHNSSDNRKLNTFSCYNQFRISNNWCGGIYKSKVVVHHHTNYMPWLTLYNSEALLLSVGSELRCLSTDRNGIPLSKPILWKCEVPKVKRHDVRTNDISRFVVSENLIVCGNRDGSTAVFRHEDMKEIPRLLFHIEDCHEDGQEEVSAVEVIDGPEKSCAITGSIHSPSLLIWNFNTDGPISGHINDPSDFSVKDLKFSDEVRGIRSLSLDDDKSKLAIGLNGNSKPLLLDINMSKLLMTADSTMNRRQTIRDIRWHDPNTILTVTHYGKLQLIDIRTQGVVFDMMDPFQSTLYCVKSDGDRAVLVGTSEYCRCVLFDTRYHVCHVQMYFTQKKTSPVYSLDFDSTKLIAAADRSVAALNFDIKSYSVKPKDYSEKFEFVNR